MRNDPSGRTPKAWDREARRKSLPAFVPFGLGGGVDPLRGGDPRLFQAQAVSAEGPVRRLAPAADDQSPDDRPALPASAIRVVRPASTSAKGLVGRGPDPAQVGVAGDAHLARRHASE